MASEIGKKVSCDKCKASVFLKYVGTDHMDGGFTRNDKFEDEPVGWRWSSDLQMKLCPTCTRGLAKALNNFVGEEVMDREGKLCIKE